MSRKDWASGFSFIPFPTPVDFPDSDIEDTPRVSLCFNADWLPWVLGALKVLARSETWDADQETSDVLVEQAMRLQTLVTDGCETVLPVPNWHLELVLTSGFYDADLWNNPQRTTVGGEPALHYRLMTGYALGVGADVLVRGIRNSDDALVGGQMNVHVEAANPTLVEPTSYGETFCDDTTFAETSIDTPYDVDSQKKNFEFVAGYFAESEYLIDIIIVGDWLCGPA